MTEEELLRKRLESLTEEELRKRLESTERYHYRPAGWQANSHLCGASSWKFWTHDEQAVTCPDCRNLRAWAQKPEVTNIERLEEINRLFNALRAAVDDLAQHTVGLKFHSTPEVKAVVQQHNQEPK